MRLCSIASGSSGNCIYVGSEATHLLVDVGISGKKAEAGLNSLGLTGRDLDGILVTHEHMDHVAGSGVMARKTRRCPSVLQDHRDWRRRLRRMLEIVGRSIRNCAVR